MHEIPHLSPGVFASAFSLLLADALFIQLQTSRGESGGTWIEFIWLQRRRTLAVTSDELVAKRSKVSATLQ